MRTANCLLSTALCLLLAATATAQVEIVGPTEVKAGHPTWYTMAGVSDEFAAKFVSSTTLTTGSPHIRDGHAQFWAMKPGSYTITGVVIEWDKRNFRSISINVTVVGDVPGPDPPNDDSFGKQAIKWLGSVPQSARDEVIENPLTDEKMTRQQAVGSTFVAIGKAAESLGSIKAVDVMLSTGLRPSFGNVADKWRQFTIQADAALSELKKSGATAVEYGEALQSIGEALR